MSISMQKQPIAIEIEEITDAAELAKAQAQRERRERNAAWLQAHISEVYSKHRGQCICIAGEELFVAKSATQAIALATAAHPDDDGWFTRYIPKEKVKRIYAY